MSSETIAKAATFQISKIPYEQVPQLAQKDIAYVTGDQRLQPFYKYPVNLESFGPAVEDKKKDKQFREELVDAITHQYTSLTASDPVIDNITALAHDNTFTIITAHQPSLFTGPLYYIYKIVSAITLTQQLNQRYPDYRFVPVFITGGEDHDFAEINHLHLFGKTLSWNNEESGSVGQMKTATLGPVLDELEQILGSSPYAETIFQKIKTAYTQNEKYGAATIALTHELFMDKGLVIVDMNTKALKRLFRPIIKKEILEQVSEPLISKTVERLEALGFKNQATPREINFFYLRDQIRERIVLEGDTYSVLNTNYRFTREEMVYEIEEHPERFSPNVVMRPLYQEYIFPNLAYIGGGGEIAYWLERKAQFEYFNINFPMLVRRNSVVWIDKGSSKKLEKFGFTPEQFFDDVEGLIKTYVKANAESELNFSKEKKQLEELFDAVFKKTVAIDPTLGKTVRAEETKQVKSLEQLEGRVMRAEKQKHDIVINQIRSIKEKLFPNNGLQERYDNFLSFYNKHGDVFLATLYEHLDPLEKAMVIIRE